MSKSKPLTAMAVNRLSKPGRHAVGDGLYLQIGPAGTKAWLLRYMRDGRARQMGLGAVRARFPRGRPKTGSRGSSPPP